MVSITRRASSFNKKCGVFLLLIIRSTLAAGIIQDTFAGEAGESEGGVEETTGGYFTATFAGTFTAQAKKSSVS